MHDKLDNLTPRQQRHADPQSESATDVGNQVEERVTGFLNDHIDHQRFYVDVQSDKVLADEASFNHLGYVETVQVSIDHHLVAAWIVEYVLPVERALCVVCWPIRVGRVTPIVSLQAGRFAVTLQSEHHTSKMAREDSVYITHRSAAAAAFAANLPAECLCLGIGYSSMRRRRQTAATTYVSRRWTIYPRPHLNVIG